MFGSQMVALRRGNYGSNNGQYRTVADHLQSTTLMVDTGSTPTVVYRTYYKPYGEVAFDYPGSGSLTSVGYTGQRLDGDTGLMYYGARYYDPALSMFVSADPTVPDAKQATDYDKYLYVRGNPLRFVDTLGYGPDDYYVFMIGCTSHPETCDMSHKGAGEYGKYLRGLWRSWAAIYERTGEQLSGADGFSNLGAWWKEHTRFVAVPTVGEGAESLARTLEGITGNGDIHIWGHSGGGQAILEYLASTKTMYGKFAQMAHHSLDKRIASIALIDTGVAGSWTSGDAERIRRELPRLQPDGMFEVTVENSFLHGCNEGFTCIEGDYSARSPLPIAPGPRSNSIAEVLDPARQGWHGFSYEKLYGTNILPWFKKAWK